MPSTKSPTIQPPPVKVLVVVRGGIASVVAATGNVEAFVLDLDTPRTDGLVEAYEEYPKQCTPPQFARALIAEIKQ